MRQHVNPLSNHFQKIESIPPLYEIFEDPKLPIHLDIGCAGGDYLFELALKNTRWNYLGLEIREKLVNNAKLRVKEKGMGNLYFVFGNANNILKDSQCKFLIENMKSISFNFPDPWFKKRHHKRRVIQPSFVSLLSNLMQKGSLIFIKTDVKELFDYMDLIILSNLNFQRCDNKKIQEIEYFNPNQIQTTREKYVIINKLNIYQRIYIKI